MNAIYDYKKCLWAVLLAILVNIDCLRPEEDGMLEGDLNYFFLNSFFDLRTYESGGHAILLLSFMSLSFILIFSILCGMDIYKELFGSGIYVIIRVKNKKRWIYSLIWSLAGKTLVFSLLYAMTTWLLQKNYTGMKGDKSSVFAFVLAVAFLFFTSFFIAFTINYLSICVNTRVGVFGGVAILLLMVMYTLFYEKLPVIGTVYNLRYLVPVYVCNLFYEDSMMKFVCVFGYYITILLLGFCYFATKVETLDIKLLNEDI